jgi:hypothetical protein
MRIGKLLISCRIGCDKRLDSSLLLPLSLAIWYLLFNSTRL